MKRGLWLAFALPWLLGADWPQWRGPTADGLSRDTGFPLEWNGSTGQNVSWKVPLPGAGNSSPVVRGQDVVLTASSGRNHQDLHILCYDLATGRQRWRTNLYSTPADAPFSMFPPERGHAACTPILGEEAIFALFGTGDLVAVDRQGKPLWFRSLARDYGTIRNDYGIAASPVLAGSTLIIQVDHLEGSYLLAVQAKTGQTLWKTERPGTFDNWSTPVVATVNGQVQVVTLGTKQLKGYDLATGQQLYSLELLERLCSPTPILRGTKLYAVSGPSGANVALDLAAPGAPKLLWQSKKTGPFVPSAIVVDDLYFVADDQGTVTCLDLTTGAEKWRERVANGRMRPSPVAAEGRIYFTALDGQTYIIKAAAEYELLAKNTLGEEVAASAALVDGSLILRSAARLWRIRRQ